MTNVEFVKAVKQKVFEVKMNKDNMNSRGDLNDSEHKISLLKDKRGSFADLFLFMIMAFIMLLICGIMIYVANITNQQLHSELDKAGTGLSQNYSTTITKTMGAVSTAYQPLYYLSLLIIVGMIISILIGSYFVNTHPVVFVPYIFIVIIAIIIAVVISNAYQTVTSDPNLASTFYGFVGSNYIMYYLPLWIAVMGFVGGIIMFMSMKQGEVGYG